MSLMDPQDLRKKVEAGDRKAVCELQKLAEEGNVQAQYNLGELWFCGYCGHDERENRKEAMYWLLASAEKGYKRSFFSLGRLYEGYENEKALNWFLKGAKEDDKLCQEHLGFLYFEEAVYWLGKCAENDHKLAQFYLASCYEHGLVVERDLKKAEQLYQQVANDPKNDFFYQKTKKVGSGAVAASVLARMYERGEGVEQNLELANRWLNRAKELGFSGKAN